MLEEPACPVCGEVAGVTVLAEGRDYLHDKPGTFSVLRCGKCGLMRTAQRPGRDYIQDYYPAESYAPYQVRQTDRNRNWLARMYWRLMDPKPLPRRPPGTLLEVGASHGAFIAEKRDLGWEVKGYDFSPEQCRLAKQHYGVQVIPVDLENFDYPERNVDVIAAWMVLEHLYDPVKFLEAMHAVAAPGGALALSVPDAGSMVFRFFGEYCYGWQLPTHLYHFDKHSIRTVLEAAGWRCTRISHQRSASMWVSSLEIKNRHAPTRATRVMHAIVRRTPKVLLAGMGLLLGLTGQSGKLTVWAQR